MAERSRESCVGCTRMYITPQKISKSDNLVSRVPHLTVPWSSLQGGGKMREPGNEVANLNTGKPLYIRRYFFRGVFYSITVCIQLSHQDYGA